MELKADQVEISTISDAMQKHNGADNDSSDDANYYSDPAREQRLNLLLHLIHYADLLVLASPEGSGKTTLLNRFVDRMGDDWQIHRLHGAALAQETSLSNRLADIFGSAGDGHDDRVEHLINHIPRLRRLSKPVIIIIDDAEKLTAASLQLINKMLVAGDNYGKPVHVILSGRPALDDTLALAELSALQERIAHRLDIPALSETHSTDFINSFVSQTAPDKRELFNSAVMKKIYRHAEGQPGPIIERVKEVLAEHSESKSGAKRTKETSPLPMVDVFSDGKKIRGQAKFFQSRPLIFGAIALGVALAVMGLLRLGGDEEVILASDQETIDKPAEPVSPPPVAEAPAPHEPDRSVVNALINPTTPINSEPEPQVEELEPEEIPVPVSNEKPEEVAEVADAQEESVDEAPLPVISDAQQQPLEETITVAEVVTPEPVPIEELSPESESVTTPPEVAVEETPLTVAQEESTEEAPPSVDTTEVVSIEDTVEAKPEEAAGNNGIKREAWLLDQDPNHFTLQLMAANNEAGVVKFITDNGVEEFSAYFFSRRDGNPWYAVTYGSYASRADANAVQLPASLRGVKPWVRSFGGIQNAIRANP